MDEKIKEQILVIRDSGVTNMFDISRVQREAFNNGFYELIMYIENKKADYVHVLTFDENLPKVVSLGFIFENSTIGVKKVESMESILELTEVKYK